MSTRTNAPLRRTTVNLTAAATGALDEAVSLTGDSQTDIINRALQVYTYMERVTRAGGAVYVREVEGSELERVRFL